MAFYGVNQDVMVRELNLRFKLAIQQTVQLIAKLKAGV